MKYIILIVTICLMVLYAVDNGQYVARAKTNNSLSWITVLLFVIAAILTLMLFSL